MWLVPVVALFLLIPSPISGGVKELGWHLSGAGGTDEDLHTVTSDLPLDGPDEDTDYIDFDKILAEGEDDYSEGDRIDDIATPAPDLACPWTPDDPETEQARLLRLFSGRTRLQRLSAVNAAFGFRLYRKLRNRREPGDNILLAPAGVSIAMGMVALGLGPSAQEQLYRTLGFSHLVNASVHYDNATVHKLFRKLTHRLFRRHFGCTLRSVNDLFVKRNVEIRDVFRRAAKNFYFAEPQSVDFADPAFVARANRRIEKMTRGLMQEPLKSVAPETTVMLLNSLYFKGTWETKFPKELTHYRNFRVSEKRQVRVPMMQNRGSYEAMTDLQLDCDVLRLPYSGNTSMILAVPQKLSGMRALEQNISPTLLNKWLLSLSNRTREVLLPRFRLQQDHQLIRHLKEMGLTEPFSAAADFTRMTSHEVTVDWFQHQASITVNEEGTEAAAVTHVGFMPLSTQTRFSVDRPFLFLIYEHRTGCVVFMGRVVDPTQA